MPGRETQAGGGQVVGTQGELWLYPPHSLHSGIHCSIY